MRFRLMLVPVAALAAASLFAADEEPKVPIKATIKGDLGYRDTPVLPGQKWKVHDIDRPRPEVVKPGWFATPTTPAQPPSDAIVIFDGKDTSKIKWPARGWRLGNGYLEITAKGDSVVSKDSFGDMQLHVEWMVPEKPDRVGQWRGNSGIVIMGRYEVQVLDSYDTATYADGQAGAIYGQFPPLVNPTRPPGQWNVYDIIFEAPKFEGEKLVKAPYVTVIFNGVVVHHRQEIIGQMAHRVHVPLKAHAPEAPLVIQNHDVPVRYRSIWARRLGTYDQP